MSQVIANNDANDEKVDDTKKQPSLGGRLLTMTFSMEKWLVGNAQTPNLSSSQKSFLWKYIQKKKRAQCSALFTLGVVAKAGGKLS